MNKIMLGIIGVYVLVLGLFIWQVNQETHQPINGSVSESQIVALNSLDEDQLSSLQERQRTSELPYFMTLSEQQLIKKSALEVQTQVAQEVNQKYSLVLNALIDVNKQTINYKQTDYKYVEEARDNSGADYAFAQGEEAGISHENLTLLVQNAEKNQKEASRAIWDVAWFAIGSYLLFCLVGSVILMNLEAISHWLVNLFVQDATPGPIISILLGISAVGLIARGFWILYLAYDAIV